MIDGLTRVVLTAVAADAARAALGRLPVDRSRHGLLGQVADAVNRWRRGRADVIELWLDVDERDALRSVLPDALRAEVPA